MTSIAAVLPYDTAQRTRHPLIHPTFLRTEVTRLLRNRKSLMFSVIMPMFLTLSVGMSLGEDGSLPMGHGNLRAVIMLGMVLYGTVTAATAAGASVSLETAQGWVRTLNLTPLTSASYVVTKALAGMVAGGAPVLAVTAVGVAGGARAEVGPLLLALGLAWAAGALFATLGLVIGLLLPAEITGQVMGLLLTVLGFAGGLFLPLSGWALTIGRFTPLYGVNALGRWPLTGHLETLPVLANIMVWVLVLGTTAATLYRRRTERV